MFVLLCLLLNIKADSPFKPREWVVNLDLPADQRWPTQQMLPYYNASINAALNLLYSVIPESIASWVEYLAEYLVPSMGEHGIEITSFANITNMPVGAAVLLNIFYELEAGCTSIVSQNSNGIITHGRNLDFLLAETLRHLVINVKFQQKGQTLYEGTTYVGYVGLLTGMKQDSFAITINQRNEGNRIENFLEALLIPGTRVLAFLVRDTLQYTDTLEEAVTILSTTSLAAPCYITASGTYPGQGVVITRNRLEADDLWFLDYASGRWSLVQTNDDHWKPDSDGRSTAAKQMMAKIGPTKINEDFLFQVLSTRPVLAPSTTYTTLMSSSSGNYTTYVREM